jgi:large subunit ribosomal protein L29
MNSFKLRAKDVTDLEKEISTLLQVHFSLRMQRATDQLTNHTQLRRTRRSIARAKTILSEKRKEEGTK